VHKNTTETNETLTACGATLIIRPLLSKVGNQLHPYIWCLQTHVPHAQHKNTNTGTAKITHIRHFSRRLTKCSDSTSTPHVYKLWFLCTFETATARDRLVLHERGTTARETILLCWLRGMSLYLRADATQHYRRFHDNYSQHTEKKDQATRVTRFPYLDAVVVVECENVRLRSSGNCPFRNRGLPRNASDWTQWFKRCRSATKEFSRVTVFENVEKPMKLTAVKYRQRY